METNFIDLHCHLAMDPLGKRFDEQASINRITASDIVNRVMHDNAYEFIQRNLA